MLVSPEKSSRVVVREGLLGADTVENKSLIAVRTGCVTSACRAAMACDFPQAGRPILRLADGSARLNVNEHGMIKVDQVAGGIGEERVALVWRRSVVPRDRILRRTLV